MLANDRSNHVEAGKGLPPTPNWTPFMKTLIARPSPTMMVALPSINAAIA